jgi:hypothetical protein
MRSASNHDGLDDSSRPKEYDDISHVIGAEPNAGMKKACTPFNICWLSWIVECFEDGTPLTKAHPPIE